jgi:osmoprotectant transport system ATP-binding protein
VGPSGCGKSTTLRLINRMIEPTSGRILLGGEDVTDVNPDELRRRIGYVIQQIGLFPHQTIAQNIATVPKMLGWDKKRITSRVDELMEMVGLDPSLFRDRYPKELSGGQAQRVGVARALGADPEIMLMDEPFGAIDPITRESLQNEFLKLQAELRKTIVFVTHDIDEAIKMGDRIAVLGERSVIRQHDTPERILAYPVDDYVNDFIGSGSTLKGLTFEQVSSLDLGDYPMISTADSPATGITKLEDSDHEWLLVVDENNHPFRWMRERDLRRMNGSYDGQGAEVTSIVDADATLYDTLEEMLQSASGVCCVVDADGSLEGVVELGHLSEVIRKAQQEAEQHYEELGSRA